MCTCFERPLPVDLRSHWFQPYVPSTRSAASIYVTVIQFTGLSHGKSLLMRTVSWSLEKGGQISKCKKTKP